MFSFFDSTKPADGKTMENPQSQTDSQTGAFKKRNRIGYKLICGVAIASNICILVLLSAIIHWDRQVEARTESLLMIQKELNMNLRESVTRLQDRLVKLPDQLENRPGEVVFSWLKKSGDIEVAQSFNGRETYKSRFSRSERRDLQKGKFVIQQRSGRWIVSKGIMSPLGTFTESVQQVILTPDSFGDRHALESRIKAILLSDHSGETLQKALGRLKGEIAEELLAAENNRTQMLSRFEQIEQTELQRNQSRKQRQMIIRFISIFTILINVFIIYFLTRAIVLKPLKKVVAGLRSIALGKGDLTRELAIGSKDELGELGHWFNVFMVRLRSVTRQIKQQMAALNTSITRISDVSDRLENKAARMHDMSKKASASIDLTVSKIDKMATSATRANETVNAVSSLSSAVSQDMDQLGMSSKDVSTAVATIAASIEEMYASLQEVSKRTTRGASVTQTATEKADESHRLIEVLKTSSKEINEVAVLIKSIADQTNILSLNAAIEAAGAGDHGKGFTVVANEVKVLSRRTAEATAIIKNKIKAIDSNTERVVKSILTIEDVIKEIHEIMTIIAASVEEQTASVNEISNNISHTSNYADQVSHTLSTSIEHEKQLSKELAFISVQTDTIEKDAQSALDQTEQSQTHVSAMDDAALNTYQDIRHIDDQLKRLTRMYRKLHGIVVQFKTG